MTPFYTVAQIAGLLGISQDSVRRAVARGTLPSHRFGRAIRISGDDLERFLTTRRYMPTAQPAGFRRVPSTQFARLLRDRAEREAR